MPAPGGRHRLPHGGAVGPRVLADRAERPGQRRPRMLALPGLRSSPTLERDQKTGGSGGREADFASRIGYHSGPHVCFVLFPIPHAETVVCASC